MRSRTRDLATVLAAIGCWSAAAPAWAQDSAASEALFNQGVASMEAKDYGAACPALAESHRLDPRAGTLFTLAECEAQWGRLASAVAHYSDYVGMVSHMPPPDKARHQERAKIAEDQLARLRPRVPQLALVLPSRAPQGTVVRRNGVVLKGASLGTPLPVDPGDHVVVTQAPGGPERTRRISIAEGETQRVELQVDEPVASRTPKAGVDGSSTPSDSPRADASSGSRTWAYVAGGIGIAGLAAGTVTGLMSMGKKRTVDDNCDGSVCNEQGLSAADDGKLLGNVSTVGFGVGIVGLTTGAVLLLSAPPSRETTSRPGWRPIAVAGHGGGFVGVDGSW